MKENKNKIPQLIKLKKPLVIFDLETTGLALNMDKIIEIAFSKIKPSGHIQSDDIFLNPEMKISEEAAAVHGIADEDVADKPTFREKAQELWDIFNDCYYGGFNIINFDLPILRREFLRAGMDFNYEVDHIIDSKVIYHYMEPRTLSAAYRHYCNKDHVNSHNALADVEATTEILESQLDIYQEIRDWKFINEIHTAQDDRYVDNDRKFYWRNSEAYFAFSKYRDTPLSEVARTEPSFLEWILTADFSEETKTIVKRALIGIFPRRTEQSQEPSRKKEEKNGPLVP